MQHQTGQSPDEGVEAVGAASLAFRVGAEVQHLAFEVGILADMDHASFRIESGDRFGPYPLAARRPDLGDWHRRIDGADGQTDHVAALVDFSDDAVGGEFAIGGDGGARPDVGAAALNGAVGDDIGAAVWPDASDDNAAGV